MKPSLPLPTKDKLINLFLQNHSLEKESGCKWPWEKDSLSAFKAFHFFSCQGVSNLADKRRPTKSGKVGNAASNSEMDDAMMLSSLLGP